MTLRKLVTVLAASLCLLGIAVAAYFATSATQQAAAPGAATIGGPFTLTAQDGRTVTDRSFRGEWTLVFFGFTHCPDICPTAVTDIAAALDQLGLLAKKVQPLFITVDPERDTPSVLADYFNALDKRFLGLTGTPEQIAAVAKAYRAYYKKTPQGDDYTVDHTAIIYVMGPDGRFVAHFTPQTGPDRMAAKLRELLSNA